MRETEWNSAYIYTKYTRSKWRNISNNNNDIIMILAVLMTLRKTSFNPWKFHGKKTICGVPKRHGIMWIRVISTKHPAVKITYLIDNSTSN